MSLRWKLLGGVLLILGVALAQLYLIFEMNGLQQENTLRVNVAGRQRMLSQKMAKEGLHYLSARDAEALRVQEETVRVFEDSLRALRQGGRVNIGGREAAVAATKEPRIAAALQEAEGYWQQVKPTFTARLRDAQALTPEEKDALEKGIFTASVQLLERFDRITAMYEQASAEAVQNRMMVIYALLLVVILVSVVALLYTQRYVIKSLLRIRDQALLIAQGDLREETDG